MGKNKKKGAKAAAAGDEDDILSAYMSQQNQKFAAEVEKVATVTPRANAAVVMGDKQLWVHGGECFVGDETETYGDLFRFDFASKEWGKVKPAGGRYPCARNGHQAVMVKGEIFLYGGEYTSRNGEDIIHCGDLWRFDTKELSWTEVHGLKLPSARSGHRMAVGPDNTFYIFGGYHDTGKGKPKKFNDIHRITVGTDGSLTAAPLKVEGKDKPDGRSGMCFGIAGNLACVYGGSNIQCKTMTDMWVLDVTAAAPMWQKVPFSASGLTARHGISMSIVQAKGHAYFFGGLTEEKAEGGKKRKKIVTTYNDTWALDLQSREFKEYQAVSEEVKHPPKRMSAGYVNDGTYLYVFGGVVEVEAGQQTLGDLWRMDISSRKWAYLSGTGPALGCDESDSEDSSRTDDEGVDDALTDDGLPYGYGVEEPLRVPRRLAEFSKGTIGQFNAWHYPMMNDADRNSFYEAGLNAACKAGAKSVFDIGSGAGLLTLLAAKAGATKVVGCEVRGELAAMANSMVKANGFGNRAEVMNRVSTEITTDDVVPDVIVHELFGALLLGERSLKFVAKAREELNKKAVCVPRRGTQFATLINSAELKEITDISDREAERLGLNLTPCRALKDTCGLHFTKAMGINMGTLPYTKLSERVPIASVDYALDDPSKVELEAEHELKIIADGEVTAVLLTWEAYNDDAAGGQVLSTEPGIGGSMRAAAWGQAYQLVELPSPSASIPQPLAVQKGKPATLLVRFSSDLASLQCEVIPE